MIPVSVSDNDGRRMERVDAVFRLYDGDGSTETNVGFNSVHAAIDKDGFVLCPR